MIEDFRNTGTHADQKRVGLINALKAAGIGRGYADKSLDDCGEIGTAMKGWMIENRERISEGLGFDFRGSSVRAVDLVNVTARALIRMGYSTLVLPLIRVPRLLTDAEESETLRRVQCLIIRDFETSHECPLRAYELADVEALIEDRISDQRSVSVFRKKVGQAWWSDTVEGLLEQSCRTVDIA